METADGTNRLKKSSLPPKTLPPFLHVVRHIFRLTKKCYGLASSLLNQQFGAAVILMTAPLVVDVANHQYFSVGNCFKSLGWNS